MKIRILTSFLPFHHRSNSFQNRCFQPTEGGKSFHQLERYRSKTWNADHSVNQIVTSELERYGTGFSEVNKLIYNDFTVLSGIENRSTFFN